MATNVDTNETMPQLSRRAAKKARRKQEKAAKKRQALEAYLAEVGDDGVGDSVVGAVRITSATPGSPAREHTGSVGGKAARARAARRQANAVVSHASGATALHSVASAAATTNGWEKHRPQGGAPILSQTLPEHMPIVEYLEDKEREMRIQGRGIMMKERRAVHIDCHGSMDTRSTSSACPGSKSASSVGDGQDCDRHCCDLSRSSLRGTFSMASQPRVGTMLPTKCAISSSTLLHLDLSRNELWDLSSEALRPLSSTLQTLDISRNWFESLPESMGMLRTLRELRASHNLLKPNITSSLRLETLRKMERLEIIDVRFNQKCGNRSLLESLQSALGEDVEVKMTVTYPPPTSSADDNDITVIPDRVGASPAVRDAELLRSQLEPWSTMALRRRLVADFGEERAAVGSENSGAASWADAEVTRGQVMDRLLTLYREEAKGREEKEEVEHASDAQRNMMSSHDNNGRAVVHVSGVPVEKDIRDRVICALKELWDNTSSRESRERPSIRAENYMILCSPSTFEVGSQRAAKAAFKLKKHQALWDLALEAMDSVDPLYASQCTAVAVTHNFVGSPHIDKQNVAPFYGFALGDFEDGTGSIMVECSARVVAAVDTKNRMGKVDGRYPHWVGPYNGETDRYSLIYYRTEGEVEPIGPAVFEVPTVCA